MARVAKKMSDDKQKTLRLSKELSDRIEKRAAEETQTVNSFITKVLSDHLDMEGFPEAFNRNTAALEESNRLKVVGATMDLMMNWNTLIKPYQDQLRHLNTDEREKKNFFENACRIYAEPSAQDQVTREAAVGMLNVLEGVCYGFLSGRLDPNAENAFPVEYFGFHLLLPIQVAFYLTRDGQTGWPKLEEFLKDRLGQERFDQEFDKYKQKYIKK